jgi:hypothetical protein
MYFPEDIWYMILHEYLWSKHNKYWLNFRSRDKLMLELTDKNAKNFDNKTKALCINYTKYSKFFHWIYIPKCFKQVIMHNKYDMVYKLQRHTNDNLYILFERMKILTRYLKRVKNRKLYKELMMGGDCIRLMIKKNNYLINTKIDEEIEKCSSNKLINLLEKNKSISIEIITKLHDARASKFFK